MRIVVSEFMSLDGVVQAPGGPKEDTDGGFAHGGWSMPYFDMEVMGSEIDRAMQSTQAMMFGRRTWQVSAAAWPQQSGDPFADRLNALPKYVVSGTLTEQDLSAWQDSRLVRPGELRETVERLRAQEGGDLQIYGSASLVRTLLSEGLVDEYRLMIEPVLLGGGKRAFPEDGRLRKLKLVSCREAKTGVLICVYHPAED
ncbi:dihydrofolate reductase family protein [Streptomyces aidingensis]|uniref:Dihydrofolate reductase n=1 Tax=Streptomyces aidingensis TaxID=910347 RepID=A0A1I1F1P9_9ACTN|nr:dihydrofolate reductase family protein [Streptomyces aidingensis]SFB92852.1 Dihydrofolate reductase [Streptomyces aidingensis]